MDTFRISKVPIQGPLIIKDRDLNKKLSLVSIKYRSTKVSVGSLS